MLDFREIPKDGNGLELMTRELLFQLGYHVQWSGVGPDAGKDLVCTEEFPSRFLPATRKWLVQCKHNAHSGKAVGISDLDNIIDSCSQHGVDAYLLVSSTHPSSHVVERLEAITANPTPPLLATYWDAAVIERLLETPRTWGVAQSFLPVSSGAEQWKSYATESPDHWIVVNKDLYLHVWNRIGSFNVVNLQVVRRRLEELHAISLPEKHFFSLRAIYYDDKNANFTWYVDYMRPNGDDVAVGCDDVLQQLGEGWVYDDGQCYYFDIVARTYSRGSEHYDRNHSSYYEPYIGYFSYGGDRPGRGRF